VRLDAVGTYEIRFLVAEFESDRLDDLTHTFFGLMGVAKKPRGLALASALRRV